MPNTPQPGQAGVEIEITPEMIEAGAAYILDRYPSNGIPILGFEADEAERLVRLMLLRIGFRLADDCFPNDNRKAVELASSL